jgi:hypothetical protein
LIQGYPDGHLDQHRHQTAGRAYPRILVELHLLLSQFLLILTMLLLEFGKLWLKALHGFSRIKLLSGQGIHQPPYNNGQDNYSQPEATKQYIGQPDDHIYHRLESDYIPYCSNIQLNLPHSLAKGVFHNVAPVSTSRA